MGQIRGRLLASGSVIISGALCLGGLPDANTVAIAISTVTGILSGIVANDLGSLTERLRQDDRSNDDLTKAVGQAIALVILTAAEAETYPNYRRDLRKLAKTATQYWSSVANATKDAPEDYFAAIKDDQLAELFANRVQQT
ncbi:MAG: hypothetical protein KME06_05985 [Kastovskya adunca ATA6-11-RM4]|nr:hypothetical protein [Kastovskya adunca ATA6-11-RM4]